MRTALAIREETLDPKTAKLRALRLARDAERAATVVAIKAAAKRIDAHTARSVGYSRANFWDNVDTSGGEDACHIWTGERKWNHTDPNVERYQDGQWSEPGCRSRITRRVMVFKTYGKEVPEGKDICPLCDEYLCCNLKHMVVTPHGGTKAERLRHAVTVEEFFCEPVRAAA